MQDKIVTKCNIFTLTFNMILKVNMRDNYVNKQIIFFVFISEYHCWFLLQFFLEDSFGLRTLYKRGGVLTFTFPGIQHHQWYINRTVFEKAVLPFLNWLIEEKATIVKRWMRSLLIFNSKSCFLYWPLLQFDFFFQVTSHNWLLINDI